MLQEERRKLQKLRSESRRSLADPQEDEPMGLAGPEKLRQRDLGSGVLGWILDDEFVFLYLGSGCL